MEINLLLTLRQNLRAALVDRVHRRASKFLGIDIPLVGQHRLDDHLGAVTKGLHDFLILNERNKLCAAPDLIRGLTLATSQRPRLGGRGGGCGDHHGKPLGVDGFNHAFARLKPVEPAKLVRHKVDGIHAFNGKFTALRNRSRLASLLGIGRTIGAHRALGVHQPIAGNVVALRNAIVVEIMRAGDFYSTGAEIHVRIVVGDDRNQAAVFLWPHRNFAQLADDRRIAFIIGVNGHRAIAEHGFGARRGNGNIVARLAQGDIPVLVLLDIFISLPASQRVFEMPHMAVALDILDLKIGYRRFKMRIPVDQPLAAIDQPLVVKVDKDLQHGIVEILVHRKGVAVPVRRTAKALKLVHNRAARLLLPRPYLVHKCLAPQFAAALIARSGKLLFNNKLRGNAGMVLPRLPQHIKAAHPVPAGQDVLQGVVEGMAHMQAAGHVGRWNHNAERFCPRLGIRSGGKGFRRHPAGKNRRLGAGGIKGFFHRHHSFQFGHRRQVQARRVLAFVRAKEKA